LTTDFATGNFGLSNLRAEAAFGLRISEPEQRKTAKEQPKPFAVFFACEWLPPLRFRQKPGCG
jgi:hypothetical protein